MFHERNSLSRWSYAISKFHSVTTALIFKYDLDQISFLWKQYLVPVANIEPKELYVSCQREGGSK